MTTRPKPGYYGKTQELALCPASLCLLFHQLFTPFMRQIPPVSHSVKAQKGFPLGQVRFHLCCVGGAGAEAGLTQVLCALSDMWNLVQLGDESYSARSGPQKYLCTMVQSFKEGVLKRGWSLKDGRAPCVSMGCELTHCQWPCFTADDGCQGSI